MNHPDLLATAHEVAGDLSGAQLEQPFGPAHQVYKVGGKIFLILNDHGLTVKAEPEDSWALRQSHAEISPGYHMNKKHWITAKAGPTIDQQLVTELVTDSHRLVAR